MKYKLIIFLTYCALFSILFEANAIGVMTFGTQISYVENLRMDGSDFSTFANFGIDLANGAIFIVYVVIVFLINTILTTIAGFIFAHFFNKELPPAEEKKATFLGIRIIVWGVALFTVGLGAFLADGNRIVTGMFIYLPMPLITHLIVILTMKNKYIKSEEVVYEQI